MRDSLREFQISTSEHEMTILHDDGLYRHVRFAKPGSGIYRFDLVTWPGYLSITGDLESYTFCREQDMFGFFVDRQTGINPGYWAEKIVATSSVREWSEVAFRSAVVEYFWERRHEVTNAPSLFHEIREEILDWQSECEHDARGAIASFFWRDSDGKRFIFEDFIEQRDFTEYSVHYLRSLHAIVWGINQYRAAKSAAEAVA